ncbi:MAG: hypothetical protein KF845_03300 [Cyclobacteriaceae bacterium]|nr:hypothetical protein [Cyclobacteriaceae bacterium]
MVKKLFASILFVGFATIVFGQDSLSRKNYYVGLQANQLIRQLFNFGGTNTAVNNPYLLTLSSNNPQTGRGSNFGWGYTYNQFNDGDAFTQRKTSINDFFFRVGFERKRSFGKKWIISTGMDAIIAREKNTTEVMQSGFKSKTVNQSNSWGLGPRVTLNYHVTEKILLGTEANYYFKATKSTIENSGIGTSTNKTTEKQKNFQLNVPAVLFVILKF